MTQLEPGIYFGLDEDVYHADKAISRSDIVNLLDTPRTYWDNSWMNPERKHKTGDAMEYGKAFHMLLFEPERFERVYQIVPIDPWDDNKIKIAYEDYFTIVESIKVLRSGKEANDFLSGGYPEVTIVFDYNGRRYRTRHDYFTPVMSTDYKTCRSVKVRYLKREFDERGLDVQLKLYKMARDEFRKAFKAHKAHVYGQVDAAWFKMFLEAEINEMVFLFQRSDYPHPFEPLFPEDDTEENGEKKIARAEWMLNKYTREYGILQWPVCSGKTRRFSMFYGFMEGE